MWRSIFLALGITAILIGTQLFFVEQVEIKRIRKSSPPATIANGAPNSPFNQAVYQATDVNPSQTATVLYKPKDWMPWGLVAIGSLVVIYTFTLPNRSRSYAD